MSKETDFNSENLSLYKKYVILSFKFCKTLINFKNTNYLI